VAAKPKTKTDKFGLACYCAHTVISVKKDSISDVIKRFGEYIISTFCGIDLNKTIQPATLEKKTKIIIGIILILLQVD
jgi:hypothetical protein